jgi:DNA-binding NarL/FixJ family response regulator
MSVVRVLIVDDQPCFRNAARALLEAREYRVVGDADCAAGAIEATERLAPDAVLLDIRLGDDDGCDVARALTRAHPGLAVLLVSSDDDRLSAAPLEHTGACGFVLKSRLVTTDLAELWPETVA